MNPVLSPATLAHSSRDWSRKFAQIRGSEAPPGPGLDDPLPGVLGDAPAIRAVCRRTRLVAASRSNVLLIGETGTGKEAIARNIHQMSARTDAPYIRVNCGALTESLLESELFGHVKGAFTGASDNKTGRFEAAHGGTLFLDEINSISPKLQAKLLRVLQEREFERVGETRTIQIDTRVISATNACLENEVAAGRFRQDLYYRLNVVPIHLPPLRERKEDIPKMAYSFLERFCEEASRSPEEIPPGILKRMLHYDWPGNVRELENHVERAVSLSPGRRIEFEHMVPVQQKQLSHVHQDDPTNFDAQVHKLVRAMLRDLPDDESDLYGRVVGTVERELLEQSMRKCDNVVARAAARLGINRNTLFKKLKELRKNCESVSISLCDTTPRPTSAR